MDVVLSPPARTAGRRRPVTVAKATHLRRPSAGCSRGKAPLRIAMLAPPWISVPPPGYGGVESVVSALTEALVGADTR